MPTQIFNCQCKKITMIKETLYNAFTKIGTSEKRNIIDFLYANIENCIASKSDTLRVVENAVKDNRASFGGFILELSEANKILGVAIVNQTGMEGITPKNVLVQIATSRDCDNELILKRLVKRVLVQTGGELGLQILPDNPAISYFQNIGFRTSFLVMKYQNPSAPSKVYRRYRTTIHNS
ncbi:MAG TPA: hypothetical protein ENK52_03740 [Saprospiraceae bacterium]|nr:hypothetical protein [Saprospiraceae bacterium]